MRSVVFLILLGSNFCIQAQQKDSPKVIVGIVVDQMCYDYLYRYYNRFEKNGFVKLMNKGTHCRNMNYNYIPTFTGPVHASIYTGTTPADHGIVGNEWFDRASGKIVNCVEDSNVQTVGSTTEYGKFSPDRLKVNTLSDQLKMTYPEAKILAVSIKNRGAILPGGHLSDGSYWYDYSNGDFITSTFYTNELPAWVKEFNAKKEADRYLKQTWNTLYPIESYVAGEPDDSPYEHLLSGKSNPVFPYHLPEMVEANPTGKYNLFTYTPFANSFLTDFALQGMKAEGLGLDKQSDLLLISYSTPDIAGHAFGPYAVEIEDMYLRLDQDIAKLIGELESQFGKKGFTLFLTADHAVVPVPQYLIDRNLPGGYFFLNDRIVGLKNDLTAHFGSDLLLAEENLNIYLNHDSIAILERSREEIEDFVIDRIKQWPEVKAVYSASQLQQPGTGDKWFQMMRAGFHREESGDVLFMLEPGFLPKSADSHTARKGTSHGSAFSYDTHVPLIWYGKNIPKMEVHRNLNITDITATLAQLLFIQNPDVVSGQPILELFGR